MPGADLTDWGLPGYNLLRVRIPTAENLLPAKRAYAIKVKGSTGAVHRSAATRLTPIVMKNILILCTGNSCRSQMAEGYLRQKVGDRVNIYSAGIEAHGVNPRAVASMREDGIDISAQISNTIDEFGDVDFDLVITVCDNARERCPVLPSKATTLHRDFLDPTYASGSEQEVMQAYHHTRNQIKSFMDEVIEQHC